MIEGKVEIYLSYKEPIFKERVMWLRPYLDREGFELLYYGANGWTVFVPCHPSASEPNINTTEEEIRISSCECSN